MDTIFIVVVVGLSSLAAALVARGHARRGLPSAVGKALETIGLTAVFLCLNVGLGFCLILLVRVVTGGFASLYKNDDVTILALSVLQALLFHWWREPER
jgi:hypothetical protein